MVKKGKSAKPAKRIGRPVVDDADRRDTLVRVLTTKAEHEELQQAAASVSMSVSTWMRALALEHARAIVLEKAKQAANSSS